LLQRHILFDGKPKILPSLLDENLSLKIDQRGREGGRGLSAWRGLRKQEKDKKEEDEEKGFLAHGRPASSFSGMRASQIWAKSNSRSIA